jgi:hypothetical protein
VTTFLQYNVTSNDSQWFFCAQTGHCQAGMVFAINPGKIAGETFKAFQENANKESQPGEGD